MEKYVDNLLTNWLNLGYDINSFEYRLLDCKDKIDMYMKYFDICLPLLLSTDKIALLEAASRLGMNETQVLEVFSQTFITKLVFELHFSLALLHRYFWTGFI